MPSLHWEQMRISHWRQPTPYSPRYKIIWRLIFCDCIQTPPQSGFAIMDAYRETLHQHFHAAIQVSSHIWACLWKVDWRSCKTFSHRKWLIMNNSGNWLQRRKGFSKVDQRLGGEDHPGQDQRSDQAWHAQCSYQTCPCQCHLLQRGLEKQIWCKEDSGWGGILS